MAAAAASSGATNSPAAAAGRITIGKDMTVNRLGFGAMRVTGDGIWGDPPDVAEAKRVLRLAVELGVDFIDTADAYGPDVSERLIAEALYPYPKGLVIATKGGLVRPAREKWERDGRPAHLREACEASLKRLRLERIDLYQFHAIDPKVPLEESLGEIAKLQKEGKIRHVGVSNFDVGELERARKIVPVVSVQNRYNVSDRSSDPVLAVCERDGLAFIPWSPLSQSARDSNAGSRAALDAWARRAQTFRCRRPPLPGCWRGRPQCCRYPGRRRRSTSRRTYRLPHCASRPRRCARSAEGGHARPAARPAV